MSIHTIKAFSQQAQTDDELKDKLKACLKIKDMLALAREPGQSRFVALARARGLV